MPSLLAVPAAIVLVMASTSTDAKDKPTVSSLDGSLPAVRGRLLFDAAPNIFGEVLQTPVGETHQGLAV